jgi:hypothetical protein
MSLNRIHRKNAITGRFKVHFLFWQIIFDCSKTDYFMDLKLNI